MMYIRWDSQEQVTLGSPSNLPGEESDWVRCELPGRRKSRAQTMVWTMTQDSEGEDVLVGSWQGSDDPGEGPASIETIRQAWKEIMQYPVAADDGTVFDFDRDSRDMIEGGIRAMQAAGVGVNWRLYDNSEIPVTAASLQTYYDQLLVNQAVRGLTVDQEYVAFKANGATHNQINAWLESHLPGE